LQITAQEVGIRTPSYDLAELVGGFDFAARVNCDGVSLMVFPAGQAEPTDHPDLHAAVAMAGEEIDKGRRIPNSSFG
jgi:hypothetical protein